MMTMIKNRNILILAVVLVVLLGISLVQKAGHKKSTSGSATVKVVEGIFTADQLDRITLGQGQDEEAVVLVSTPTGWVVASSWDSPAGLNRIEALLRNLGDLSGEFRSDNASVLADYGLSDEDAVKVRAYNKQGDLALAVDIGDKPERFPGNFIKRPGSSAVYLSSVNLLAQLGLYDGPAVPGGKHFLELQVVKEDRLDVDRIILTDGDQVLELVKEFAKEQPTPGQEETAPVATETETGGDQDEPAGLDRTTWEWKLTAPRAKTLAKTKADGVLGSLISIRASDVDDPAGDLADYGLAEPSRTGTIIRQDGSQLTVEFGNTREAVGDVRAGTWMKVRGEPNVWVVADYTVNNIFKSEEDLLPEQE
jgi:hypothetical protein